MGDQKFIKINEPTIYDGDSIYILIRPEMYIDKVMMKIEFDKFILNKESKIKWLENEMSDRYSNYSFRLSKYTTDGIWYMILRATEVGKPENILEFYFEKKVISIKDEKYVYIDTKKINFENQVKIHLDRRNSNPINLEVETGDIYEIVYKNMYNRNYWAEEVFDNISAINFKMISFTEKTEIVIGGYLRKDPVDEGQDVIETELFRNAFRVKSQQYSIENEFMIDQHIIYIVMDVYLAKHRLRLFINESIYTPKAEHKSLIEIIIQRYFGKEINPNFKMIYDFKKGRFLLHVIYMRQKSSLTH